MIYFDIKGFIYKASTVILSVVLIVLFLKGCINNTTENIINKKQHKTNIEMITKFEKKVSAKQSLKRVLKNRTYNQFKQLRQYESLDDTLNVIRTQDTIIELQDSTIEELESIVSDKDSIITILKVDNDELTQRIKVARNKRIKNVLIHIGVASIVVATFILLK